MRQDRKNLAPRLSRRVAGESWGTRVEEISRLIESALARQEGGAKAASAGTACWSRSARRCWCSFWS
ncbi:MAG: hypothetical protein QME74_09255 [Candidatus Edwardsbacteria bacterium]|nr:hypothetical protein [Candidatus Edwardsbacteria bacterium]